MTMQPTGNIARVQDSINYYGFLLLALSMSLPFYPVINIAIFTIGVNAVAGMIIQKRFIDRRHALIVGLPTALFFLYFLGVSYSENTSAAWGSVERKVPLLLLPAAAAFFTKFDRKQIDNILLAFVAGCILISIVSVVTMLKRNIDDGIAFEFYNNFYFSQDNLVLSVGFHHVYFAMYMCMCVAICLYFLSTSEKRLPAILFGVAILWSILFMFGLSARMAVITMILVLQVYFLFVVRMSWPTKIFIDVAAILTLVFVGYQFPIIREKVEGVLNINVNQFTEQYKASTRMVPVALTWDIFKNNWIGGVGSGDLPDMLMEEYKRVNFEEGLMHEYNTHNQYVDTAATTGIGGILLLSGIMITLYFYAWQSRDFLAIAFAIIVSFCFLTESMLARTRGVVFLATFISLIVVHREQKRDALLEFRLS